MTALRRLAGGATRAAAVTGSESGRGRRAGRVALGLIVDRLLGDPPDRLHPVAHFGRAMTRLERHLWADSRLRGVAYAAAGLGQGLLAGRLVGSVPVAVAASVAGRQLRGVATEIGERLEEGDLQGARELLPSLVGRDPSRLDESGVAAAVIESLAENSVDAVVAPAMWALALGAPGALGYRAVNTMDAMVGHRDERFARFGTAAARLDDVANLIPARVFAALVVLTGPRRWREVIRAVARDAPAHPSPNAGVAEAAVAAALGVELGGPLRYGSRAEVRPRLGRGPRPGPSDIRRAVGLVDRVELLMVAALVAVDVGVRRGGRRV